MLVIRDTPDWGGGWVWPVPDMPDNRALISNPFRRPVHRGVDIMYRGVGGDYFAPVDTPIVAARPGTIWSAEHTARGFGVVVDHGAPFATFYQHLQEIDPWVRKGAAVSVGHRMGLMGADPTDPELIRHLHFEVWWRGAGESAVDPAPMLAGARRVLWTP
jgi:murein DD-endopeptidase MepM/ murein hydrolase activator NlpD